MTPFELAAYEAKSAPKQSALIPTSDEREEELHDMIISWCRRQDPQIPFGHGSMAHKTKRTPGEVDFYLLMPGGRVLLIECKTEDGQLSDDQRSFATAAKLVGHTVHVVRDYTSFLSLVKSHE